jgi:hypothetical protein
MRLSLAGGVIDGKKRAGSFGRRPATRGEPATGSADRRSKSFAEADSCATANISAVRSHLEVELSLAYDVPSADCVCWWS